MKTKNILYVLILLLTVISCARLLEGIATPLPKDPLTPEVSQNDPKSLGLDLEGCDAGEMAENYDSLYVLPNLPAAISLRPDMPPVKSQGSQGSCAAWAVGYYFKSFQEKEQYGYEYDSYDKVISPAFLYNKGKDKLTDCVAGMCIEMAFHILKTEGSNNWEAFPYNANDCKKLPTPQNMLDAQVNKIERFFAFSTLTDTDVVDVIKTKLVQRVPLVMGMNVDTDFADAMPRNQNDEYIYKEYHMEKKYGQHGMVIVGYDDNLQAFEVVNSWGTDWGNQGYCWISYDFFRPITSPDYKPGLLTGLYFATDKIVPN